MPELGIGLSPPKGNGLEFWPQAVTGHHLFRALDIFAGAGVDAHLHAFGAKKRNIDFGTGFDRGLFRNAIGGIAFNGWLGIGDNEVHENRRRHGNGLFTPESDFAFGIFHKPFLGTVHGFLGNFELLKGLGVHEGVVLAIGIQELHVGIRNVGFFRRIARLIGALYGAPSQQIFDADAIESLAFAGLHEFVIDYHAWLPVDDDAQALTEFIGGNHAHDEPLSSYFSRSQSTGSKWRGSVEKEGFIAVAESMLRTGPPLWQADLRQAFRAVPDLLEFLELDLRSAPFEVQQNPEFPLRVPLAFARRMRKGDWQDPLLAQVLPLGLEGKSAPGFTLDAVGDTASQCAPGLLHKYANRVLMLPTAQCAVHCRYCFRRHFAYEDLPKGQEAWEAAWAYLEQNPEIDEVLLSGGDPLSLDDHRLRGFWQRAVHLPQIRAVRLHTRLPVVLPSRIDDRFLALVREMTLVKTGVMVIHANHAQEIDEEVGEALRALKQAGLLMLNQSVLLRGINDSTEALKNLSQRLIEVGVMPYYLHMLDRVAGTSHFEVEEARAKEMIEALKLKVQGYMVPKLVREVQGEGAKRGVT